MFEVARLKLTGWYLLIIMTISLAFSGVIYRTSSMELARFAEAQRLRFERRMIASPIFIDDQLLEEAKRRMVLSLLFTNIGILGLASILGYYLSGKTLAPIADMVREQYRFVSDASHELKTPITAIKTTLEVSLRDKKLTINEAKDTLATSLEEVNRLQKLAEGLLELTHKNVIGKLIKTDIKAVVKDAVAMTEPIAMKKKIMLVTKVSKAIIMADGSALGRAVVTVIDNAIKYSKPENRIEISSWVRSNILTLKIRDYGVGIKSEDLPFIFDRFYRAERARHTNGYGLGLSIAKKIVEAHDGDIVVSSKFGSVTTVIITLPYSARLQGAKLG